MSRGLLIAGGVLGGGALLALILRESESGAPAAPAPAVVLPPPAPAPVLAPAPVAAPATARAPLATTARKIAIIGNSIAAGGFPGKVRVPGAAIRYKGWGGEQAVAITRKAIKEKVVDADLTDVVLEAGVNNIASEIVGQQKRKQALDGAKAAESVIRDLGTAVGLIRTAAPRARVWLPKMPPWRGYAKYFGAGKATASPILAATDAVDAWLVARAGQADGPDRVIDLAPLADAQGRYLPRLSKDNLHPSNRDGFTGVTTLAARVSDALIRGIGVGAPVVIGGVAYFGAGGQ